MVCNRSVSYKLIYSLKYTCLCSFKTDTIIRLGRLHPNLPSQKKALSNLRSNTKQTSKARLQCYFTTLQHLVIKSVSGDSYWQDITLICKKVRYKLNYLLKHTCLCRFKTDTIFRLSRLHLDLVGQRKAVSNLRSNTKQTSRPWWRVTFATLQHLVIKGVNGYSFFIYQ